jgi:succinate dehydrogenase (ubiquinone) membrane anchor subunit
MLRQLLVSRSQLRLAGTRSFRASATKSADAKDGIIQEFMNADASSKLHKVYHMTTFASLGLFPLALILSPSALCMPVDLALGVVFPVHGHIGFSSIISDYVPKPARGAARMGLAAITVISLLGLLKVNLAGDGITGTVKSMWKSEDVKKK